jgi:hypothetical protein
VSLGAARVAQPLVCAAFAVVVSGILVAFGALGGDAPAHLHRTMLAKEGLFLWDSLWYGGHHPPSYGVLYYAAAAIFGNVPLVVAANAASAALFAAVTEREWGAAALWPARVFAVLVAGALVTGTYPYAVGLAALLVTLWALQHARVALAVVFAALTLAFSALASVLLCLALLAVGVARRPTVSRVAPLALCFAALGIVELTLWALFPLGGTLPFEQPQLAAVLAVAALGFALALRADRLLAALFLVWGAANIVAFVIPTAIGPNLTRPRFIVFALVLLAAALTRFRPYSLAAPALAVALVYSVLPYGTRLPAAMHARTDDAAFWEPAIDFLEVRVSRLDRIEVVPTAAHWEAYYLPQAGFALARGWFRQLDRDRNGLLYRDRLPPSHYRAWLRRLRVHYVVLPLVKLDTRGTAAEARLLHSGRSGLPRLWRGRDFVVYRVP